MIQTIRDWLDQPIVLSEVLPFAVMGGLLVLALAGAFRRVRTTVKAADPDRPGGFLARWFRTMRLAPGEGLVVRGVFAVFAVLFVMAIATAFVLVGGVLWQAATAPQDATPSASLGLGALLVALLGAPFLIWRTLVAQRTLEATQRQTQLQEESLFNDKINAAATDLAVRRQVTRVVKDEDGKETILTEWQDDLVTRAAAIDRLEGLALAAIARGDFPPAQRIARMLSIYVQELSRAYPAKPAPTYESQAEIQKWAATLRPVQRPDMERAAQSLGRINPEDDGARETFDPRNIDLRRCNLQGFDLRGLNYTGGQFTGAKLQGANLERAKMQVADFSGVEMQGADLKAAQMQGATLFNGQMQGARLNGAQMQGARLCEAQMQGADLFNAQMQGADLFKAQMQGAVLLNAKMQGADLSGALLQGAYLAAELGPGTTFRAGLVLAVQPKGNQRLTATLRGVAVRYVEAQTIEQLHPFWEDIVLFAEALPDGAPAHWVRIADEDPDHNNFASTWRAWAATLYPPVTIATDYRPD